MGGFASRGAAWALVAAAAVGCGASAFGDFPRGDAFVTPLASPSGWVRVDEPGWFAAAMPGAPKTSLETIAVQDSHVQVKALSASDDRVWTWIRYFEVSAFTTMLDPETLMRAGRDDVLAITGVRFLREEPRRPGGPALDMVCTVAPRSPLDPSDLPMLARIRGYAHAGTTARLTFAIAVWPEGGTDEEARGFFEGLHVY